MAKIVCMCFITVRDPLRTFREDIVFSMSTMEGSIKILFMTLLLSGWLKKGLASEAGPSPQLRVATIEEEMLRPCKPSKLSSKCV